MRVYEQQWRTKLILPAYWHCMGYNRAMCPENVAKTEFAADSGTSPQRIRPNFDFGVMRLMPFRRWPSRATGRNGTHGGTEAEHFDDLRVSIEEGTAENVWITSRRARKSLQPQEPSACPLQRKQVQRTVNKGIHKFSIEQSDRGPD